MNSAEDKQVRCLKLQDNQNHILQKQFSQKQYGGLKKRNYGFCTKTIQQAEVRLPVGAGPNGWADVSNNDEFGFKQGIVYQQQGILYLKWWI